MGDITEMILEGVLCEGCGTYMDDGEEPGHPRKCDDCKKYLKRKPLRKKEE